MAVGRRVAAAIRPAVGEAVAVGSVRVMTWPQLERVRMAPIRSTGNRNSRLTKPEAQSENAGRCPLMPGRISHPPHSEKLAPTYLENAYACGFDNKVGIFHPVAVKPDAALLH